MLAYLEQIFEKETNYLLDIYAFALTSPSFKVKLNNWNYLLFLKKLKSHLPLLLLVRSTVTVGFATADMSPVSLTFSLEEPDTAREACVSLGALDSEEDGNASPGLETESVSDGFASVEVDTSLERRDCCAVLKALLP